MECSLWSLINITTNYPVACTPYVRTAEEYFQFRCYYSVRRRKVYVVRVEHLSPQPDPRARTSGTRQNGTVLVGLLISRQESLTSTVRWIHLYFAVLDLE